MGVNRWRVYHTQGVESNVTSAASLLGSAARTSQRLPTGLAYTGPKCANCCFAACTLGISSAAMVHCREQHALCIDQRDARMDDERQHLSELLQIYQRRLRGLEKQAATLGVHTPPYVQAE